MHTKHSPAPWHAGQGNGTGSVFTDAGRMRLESGGSTLYPVCRMVTGWDPAEDAANERLVVASPKLLAAAIRVLESAGFESGEAEPSLRELRVGITHLRRLRDAVIEAGATA